MSRENVQIVREAWDAWGRGDMPALFEFYDPEVEWDMSHSYIPDMGVFRGHDGIRAFFREWGLLRRVLDRGTGVHRPR